MKKILFLMILLPVLTSAQNMTFTIKAEVKNVANNTKAYLTYNPEGKSRIDSASIINGKFQFMGELVSPLKATLILSHDGIYLKQIKGKRDQINFYLEATTIEFSGVDSISKSVISGSRLNDENRILKKSLLPSQLANQKLFAENPELLNNTHRAEKINPELQQKLSLIEEEKSQAILAFIKKYPASWISFYALQDYAGPMPEASEIVPVFDQLAPNIKQSIEGLKYYKSLIPGLRTAVGKKAPLFSLPDTTGKTINLTNVKGKYRLIDFWASWCVPCRAENPVLIAAYSKYKQKGFEIIGVSLERTGDKASWIKAIKEDGLTWLQLSDLKYWKSEVVADYGIKAVPQNFLIDEKGVIVAKNLRGEALEKKLAEIFKE